MKRYDDLNDTVSRLYRYKETETETETEKETEKKKRQRPETKTKTEERDRARDQTSSATIMPFRLSADRRMVKIIVHSVQKPGKAADAFWRATLKRLNQRMEAVGVEPCLRQRELYHLHVSVQAELNRQVVSRYAGPSGDAA